MEVNARAESLGTRPPVGVQINALSEHTDEAPPMGGLAPPVEALTPDEAMRVRIAVIFGRPTDPPDPLLEAAIGKLGRIQGNYLP